MQSGAVYRPRCSESGHFRGLPPETKRAPKRKERAALATRSLSSRVQALGPDADDSAQLGRFNSAAATATTRIVRIAVAARARTTTSAAARIVRIGVRTSRISTTAMSTVPARIVGIAVAAPAVASAVSTPAARIVRVAVAAERLSLLCGRAAREPDGGQPAGSQRRAGDAKTDRCDRRATPDAGLGDDLVHAQGLLAHPLTPPKVDAETGR